MKMRILAVLLLSALSSLVAHGQSLPAKGVSDIDSVLQNAVQQKTVPGVVAIVVSKDKILYHNAFGLQDVANNKPMQKESIFRIASMTKQVTSAAVMLLVEQGKLKLDDPVSKYLPEFSGREVVDKFDPPNGTLTTRKAAGEVLIRHLLTNTSGLAYGFSNPQVTPLQQKTGKQRAEDLPLLYDPGTRWTYSGSTRILGLVVEKLTGGPLDRFFNDNFFKAMGMNDTFYAVPADKTSRVVTTHSRATGSLVETRNQATITSPVAGDGGLSATAADYSKFLQMFLNDGKVGGKAVLSKNAIQTMTKNQIGNVVVDMQPAVTPNLSRPFPSPPHAGRDKFGFGFELTTSNKEEPNLRSPGSYTWAGIYNTHFWVDPKREIAAVLMFQVLPFYDEGTMKVYHDFEEAIGKNLR
jgi:methyl acetate hydrolase